MWRYKRVQRTTLIGLGSASVLCGLGAVHAGVQIRGWMWLVFATCLLIAAIKRRALVAVLAIILAGFIFGAWRGGDTLLQLDQYQQLIGNKLAVSGTVVEDPTYDDKGQRDFRLEHIIVDGQTLPGQMRVKSFSLTDVRRGDRVVVEGKLLNGFGNYQASMYYADIIEHHQHHSVIEDMRRQFAAYVLTNIPEPQASLGLGFLVGLKSGLTDQLQDQLKVLGLTHIVVASGYNLTILVRIARRLLEQHSKYQTAVVSIALILGFVAVTGFSPSMSRAALVTGLALAAWYFGRRIHPVILLGVVAATTALVNPLYLWSDIGWWLSFLAFAGVMLIAPLLQHRIFGTRTVPLIVQVVIETCAAQLLTLPFILWIFGDLSVLALLANVLAVPFVPLAMLLTLIAGVGGVILPALAIPAVIVLGYITEIVQLLAAIPWASMSVSITTWMMLACYGFIVSVWLLMLRRAQYDYLSRSVIE